MGLAMRPACHAMFYTQYGWPGEVSDIVLAYHCSVRLSSPCEAEVAMKVDSDGRNKILVNMIRSREFNGQTWHLAGSWPKATEPLYVSFRFAIGRINSCGGPSLTLLWAMVYILKRHVARACMRRRP